MDMSKCKLPECGNVGMVLHISIDFSLECVIIIFIDHSKGFYTLVTNFINFDAGIYIVVRQEKHFISGTLKYRPASKG